MIEVVARLKGGGPAFFAGGEKIACIVTFRSVNHPEAVRNSFVDGNVRYEYTMLCLFLFS